MSAALCEPTAGQVCAGILTLMLCCLPAGAVYLVLPATAVQNAASGLHSFPVCPAESLLNYLQLYYCHVEPIGWLTRGVAQARLTPMPLHNCAAHK